MEVDIYDCVVDVATNVMGNKIDSHIYVKLNVEDMNVKISEPRYLDLNESNEESDGEESLEHE